MITKQEEINEALEIELDKYFPKGDKARGRALVLFALAQNEINKERKKTFTEIKRRLHKWWNSEKTCSGKPHCCIEECDLCMNCFDDLEKELFKE